MPVCLASEIRRGVYPRFARGGACWMAPWARPGHGCRHLLVTELRREAKPTQAARPRTRLATPRWCHGLSSAAGGDDDGRRDGAPAAAVAEAGGCVAQVDSTGQQLACGVVAQGLDVET